MTTFTIDIPDNHTGEVIAQLKKLGVKVRESKLSKLDKLTKKITKNIFHSREKQIGTICLNTYDNSAARYS